MKIIFIRHGDPDYVNDSLTEKGCIEAELLSKRVKNWKDDITKIYVSPLGRAKKTCSYSLKELDMSATELPWLKEFYYPTHHPEQNNTIHVPWDFYPKTWTFHKECFDKDAWVDTDLLCENDIKTEAKNVFDSFDNLLKEYGYERNEEYYNVTKKHEKEPVLVFFCHLGVSLMIAGHLLGISPFVLWHSCFVAPTSVTILGSEEREDGIAAFRTQVIGDTRHLFDGNEPISSSGYFTNCFQG